MAEAKEDIQLHRGLKGIYFERSAASFIDGDVGKLLYRGYNIHDLAENSTFEETTYLLLHGSLPTRSQLSEIDKTLKSSRQIPDAVYQVIDLVKDAHPMDVLRTGISALSAFDPDVSDNSAEANIRKGARVTSQASTIVAAHHRIRQGLDPVTPDPSLGHAASFLHMLHGKNRLMRMPSCLTSTSSSTPSTGPTPRRLRQGYAPAQSRTYIRPSLLAYPC